VRIGTRAPCQPQRLCIAPPAGTCNPDYQSACHGRHAGLRPSTGTSDIYKGILEGIACELAQYTELSARVAGSFSDLYVTGADAARILLELRAAMTGVLSSTCACGEAVCLGTANSGGVEPECQRFFEAMAQLVQTADTTHPDPKIAESYRSHGNSISAVFESGQSADRHRRQRFLEEKLRDQPTVASLFTVSHRRLKDPMGTPS